MCIKIYILCVCVCVYIYAYIHILRSKHTILFLLMKQLLPGKVTPKAFGFEMLYCLNHAPVGEC